MTYLVSPSLVGMCSTLFWVEQASSDDSVPPYLTRSGCRNGTPETAHLLHQPTSMVLFWAGDLGWVTGEWPSPKYVSLHHHVQPLWLQLITPRIRLLGHTTCRINTFTQSYTRVASVGTQSHLDGLRLLPPLGHSDAVSVQLSSAQ